MLARSFFEPFFYAGPQLTNFTPTNTKQNSTQAILENFGDLFFKFANISEETSSRNGRGLLFTHAHLMSREKYEFCFVPFERNSFIQG